MGWGKFRKRISKSIRSVTGSGVLGTIGLGKGGVADKAYRETGSAFSHLTGQAAMEDMLDQQAKLSAQQEANAQRLAYQEAGAQMQTSEAGTSEALARLLKKRSALQRSIRTGGQQRLGD